MRYLLAIVAVVALIYGLTVSFRSTESVVTIPALNGSVSKAGKPVADAIIFAGIHHSPDDCENMKQIAITDVNGQFRFEGERGRQFSKFAGVNERGICIELNGQKYPGGSLTGNPQPSEMSMACDLDSPDAQNDNYVCVVK